MEGISCPRKHILNYSETRYMEIMGNIESEISAGMRGKALICYGRWNMDSLLRIFPQKRRDFWKVTADKAQEVCEIRLRVDRPVIIETSRGDFFLDHSGIWREEPYGAYSVTETEIRDLIAYLCQDSVYAYADEIRQGFLTVEGGHRIGSVSYTHLTLPTT
mgnify:FL=1